MKLSVRLQCYNQASYLEETLKSIISQKTNFSFEVIIGDDFSTDNSLEIINNTIETNNNEKIKFILLDRVKDDNYKLKRIKLGRLYNFTDILSKCEGKYIALLDGDDYWTDPLKLQKQVDLLESKPEINVCFTQAEVLAGLELTSHTISPKFIENKFDYSELLRYNNFITTASVVFRRPNNFNVPNWFLKLPYGDMGLYKLLSNSGSFYGLKDITSVYRVHDKGIYSGINIIKSRKIYYSFYKLIYSHLSEEEQSISKNKMRFLKKEIATLRFPKRVIFQKLYFIYLIVKGID